MYSGESQATFWSDISLLFSGSKRKPCKKHTQYNSVHHAGVLIGLFFDPEVGNDMFFSETLMFTRLHCVNAS